MEIGVVHTDSITGDKVIWHEDPLTGDVTLEHTGDVTAYVEANKALFAGVDERAGWKGTHHRVAQLPPLIFWDLKRRGILDDPKALKKWLNDPDNRFFRTRPGKV